MGRILHLARLESPSEALRCACGAWREAANWTTAPELVTCTECQRRLAEREQRSPGAAGLGASR